MVNRLQKRSSTDLYLKTSSVNEENKRSKSPSQRNTTNSTTRSSSSERRFKLLRKKSSKEKEQLLRGNVFTLKVDNNHNNNVCECPNVTSPKLILKTNKVAKNNKLFDAVLDDDFALTRKLIIVEELDVNDLSPEGNTVLHVAAAAGHLDCMELLIECGSKINALDNNSRTPLEYAVMYGNFECASLLIENGADSKVIKDGITL